MGYNDASTRSDVAALIPEEASNNIIQSAIEQSVVLSTFRRVTMNRNQRRIPCLSAFPFAYFVNGDTGLKQTTDQAWSNKYLDAEEIAAIAPIPEAVLDDSDFDMWGEIRPRLAEAIGRVFDAAVFFGTNAPSDWPDDVKTDAVAAGNDYTYGTNNAAAGGVAEDINQSMTLVETDGFDVNSHITYRGFRGILRSARDSNGQKLLDVETGEIEGAPVSYGMAGLGDFASPGSSGNVRMFSGDASQFMAGIRQDISWKILDQAVIQDSAGNIVFNLAQQDMVAMRIVFRGAWNVANPITHSNTSSSTRYPMSVLRTS